MDRVRVVEGCSCRGRVDFRKREEGKERGKEEKERETVSRDQRDPEKKLEMRNNKRERGRGEGRRGQATWGETQHSSEKDKKLKICKMYYL